MTTEGPSLDSLLRRMIETPDVFLSAPRIASKGDLHTRALVHDMLEHVTGSPPSTKDLKPFLGKKAAQRNHLKVVALATWMLHDRAFAARPELHDPIFQLLTFELRALGELVEAEQFVTNEDRREEFVRVCLDALGLRPEGEEEAMSEDRLKTLSSVERQRVLRASQAARQRARELEEAMRRKQAEEFAARYNRE